MGYSENPAMVRVDFFKDSGKWYTTEAVLWRGNGFEQNSGCDLFSQFQVSLREHLNGRLSGMWAVCLHPYHRHEHPIMICVGGDDGK